MHVYKYVYVNMKTVYSICTQHILYVVDLWLCRMIQNLMCAVVGEYVYNIHICIDYIHMISVFISSFYLLSAHFCFYDISREQLNQDMNASACQQCLIIIWLITIIVIFIFFCLLYLVHSIFAISGFEFHLWTE